MAFKASSTIPARGYDEAKSEAIRIKNVVTQAATRIAAGGANADEIYELLLTLGYHRDRLNTLKTIPGLADYARSQEADPTYDVAVEFSGLVTAIESTITWMQSAIPAAGGYDQMYSRPGGVQLVPRVFTAATLAPLVTRLQAAAALVV